MRATILAPGSRGDVQPYIAIAQGLRSVGVESCIVTTQDNVALVTRYGFEVAAIPVSVKDLLKEQPLGLAIENGGVLQSFAKMRDAAKKLAAITAEISFDAAKKSDVLITNFGTALLADAIARARQLTLVQAFNVPITETSNYPSALFSNLDFGPTIREIGHRLTREILWATMRSCAIDLYGTILSTEFSPPLLAPGRIPGLIDAPLLYGFSEFVLPRDIRWDKSVELTGFWLVEEPEDYKPPDALEKFLELGSAPVCVGFGSMSIQDAEAMTNLVIEAARLSQLRVILLGGWAELQPSAPESGIIALAEAPHQWLYPRCRAVVHHGGAGTTAAAISAGVPAVVVPFHGDQPFWAALVYRLELGPEPIPRKKLNANNLADAMTHASNNELMRSNAEGLGRNIRTESGANVAAQMIMRQVEKSIRTGC